MTNNVISFPIASAPPMVSPTPTASPPPPTGSQFPIVSPIRPRLLQQSAQPGSLVISVQQLREIVAEEVKNALEAYGASQQEGK
jgi:hypothetical protein